MKRAKGVLWLVFWSVLGSAATDLISDIEHLRNKLPYQDPQRQVLSLRLADLLFNQGRELKNEGTPAQWDRGQTTLKRALGLYQEGLTGANGRFAKPNASNAIRIEFQIARIYDELGEQGKSERVWRHLVAESDDANIKREAALRLAEYLEKNRDPQSQKAAEKYFSIAENLGQNSEYSTYSRYKKAWVLRRLNRLPEAIQEMGTTLYDSKGQLREESLRDYLAFMTIEPKAVESYIAVVEGLENKLAKPGLMQKLADGYLAEGLTVPGLKVLGHVQGRQPSFLNSVRILEFQYGQKDWNALELQSHELSLASTTPADEKQNAEKIFRRLLIQMDAERATTAKATPLFQTLTEKYVRFFPSAGDRTPFIRGFLISEKDDGKKLHHVERWLADSEITWSKLELQALQEAHLELAAKNKNAEKTLLASQVLGTSGAKKEEKRKYAYIHATALLDLGKKDEALTELQAFSKDGPQDEMAARAKVLELKLLAEKKRFAEVVSLGSAWLTNVGKGASADDKTKVVQLVEESRFENAVFEKNTPLALSTFKEFCLKKKFLPKSCENAKVVALETQDSNTLLAVLEAKGEKESLASEYEARAYFKEAANLYEQLIPKPTLSDRIRFILLNQLANQPAHADELYRGLTALYRSKKLDGKEKELLYGFILQRPTIEEEWITSPSWDKEERCELAARVYVKGANNPKAKDLLLSCSEATPQWVELVFGLLKPQREKGEKIALQGNNMKGKFLKRVDLLKKLRETGEKYLAAAHPETKVKILQYLGSSYEKLAADVLALAGPNPEDVEVRKSLEELVAPLQDQARQYAELEKKVQPETVVASAVAPKPLAPALSHTSALAILHEKPEDRAALEVLQNYHDREGRKPLASYFASRILRLEEKKL